MDRRHHRLVRSFSFAGAAGLAVLTLWSAGLPPTEWWASAQRWWPEERPVEQVATSVPALAPTSTVPPAAADIQRIGNEGTDSSISARAQPLYLIATAPGRSKNEGTARIGTSRANPQTYVAGALLANGARIAEIHIDHVVLERDDKRVALYMEALAAKMPHPATDLVMVGGTPAAPPPAPITREVLTDYMRPSPVFEDETLRGYQVYPGSKAGVFAQLGLQAGDIIISINDAPVLDAANAIEALQEFANGTSIVVRVERNGKTERLVLDGTLITNEIEREKNSTVTMASDLTGG